MAHSQNIMEIAKALSAFQGELKGATKDGTNPHFRSQFASLTSIWETIRVGLKKNGLALTQIVDTHEAQIGEIIPILTTTLMHTSGEWISGDMRLTPIKDNDPQAMGSALTYARRYAMGAMLGVVTDEDDDGEKATQHPQARQPQRASSYVDEAYANKAAEVDRQLAETPAKRATPTPTTTSAPKPASQRKPTAAQMDSWGKKMAATLQVKVDSDAYVKTINTLMGKMPSEIVEEGLAAMKAAVERAEEAMGGLG